MGENVAWMPMGSYLDEGLLYKQFLLERDFGMQAAYHAAEMAGMGVTQILARGLNPKDMHISPIKVIQSAGMVTEPRRRYFEQQTGEKVVNNYVTGDLGTLWAECDERKGYHLTQDLVYVEILDQETTKRVAPGERGEIVFSHLDREACPLVRYATGDMGLIWDEPCACGRTQPRLMAIGRIEWGCKIKDKTITPYDMEELMGEIDETWGKEYTIYRYAPIMDKLRCKLQYAEEKTKDKEVLKQRLINKMRDRWGIDADVELVTSAEELPTRAWKVMHVIDVE
jgi:phenylacetate-CoA ligase